MARRARIPRRPAREGGSRIRAGVTAGAGPWRAANDNRRPFWASPFVSRPATPGAARRAIGVALLVSFAYLIAKALM